MSRKSIRLSQVNLLRLIAWMKEHKSSLEELPHTRRQIADMASKELGFEISHHSIDNYAGLAEVALKSPKVTVTRKARVFTDRLKKLHEAVLLLYNKCGEPIPSDLTIEAW